MSKQNKAIEIFLRVRPAKKTYNGLTVDEESSKVEFKIPKDQQSGYINNTKEHYEFIFDKVFDQKTKQEKIFKNVAQDVCDQALEGYNGTIFAYGQTGSGKTFTMTGGPDSYEDRGIIPRTLSYLFQETKKKEDAFYQISISYIEIYNNAGYDLLDANHSAKKLEDLTPVIPRETENEEIILSGLSIHKAQTEEDALNLLYIGDLNRAVCETPKNDVSTRSHCIFTIMIESRKPNSDVKTMSRIHLVDLSGSERIKNTGVEGKLEKEARGINLSLHFLEHCIVCLNKRAQGENIHVPYRNSLMTLILRDSLGGNCKTRMVATASAEEPDALESIATCKFAQRVALVKNYAVRNESVDPAVIIERLKRENAALKAELNMLKGENAKDKLDSDDIETCRTKVEQFLASRDPSHQIILSDKLMIDECFYQLKHKYNALLKKAGNSENTDEDNSSQVQPQKSQNNPTKQNQNPPKEDADSSHLQEEIKRLKLLVLQRDNEIMILLNLINKNKDNKGGQQLSIPVQRESQNEMASELASSIVQEPKEIKFPQYEQLKQVAQTPAHKYQQSVSSQNEFQSQVSTQLRGGMASMDYSSQKGAFTDLNQSSAQKSNTYQTGLDVTDAQSIVTQARQALIQNKEINDMLLAPLNLTNEQLMDRANCLELFRRSYRRNQVMEDNKLVLKDKFEVARKMGQIVNAARSKIDQYKQKIQDLRKEMALKGLSDGNEEELVHPQEGEILQQIEEQKKIYKENFNQLKDIKSEIESIQKMLEKNKDRMQKDFEKWLEAMMQQRQALTDNGQQQNALTQSNISSNNNQSMMSQQMQQTLSKVRDKEVEKKLQAFYKARDEIYKN
ncbi:hypothetical protein ABPG74_012617 [Tetrahymena malaccensis]